MFNPNVLVSPVTALLDTIRREDDELYNLLLTKHNVEVVGTKPNDGAYNTIAVLNDLDHTGAVKKYGRVITYNQLNLESVVNAKATIVKNTEEQEEYHLLSHTTNGTIRNPSTYQIATTLNRTYSSDIDNADIELVESTAEPIPPGTPNVPNDLVEPPLPGGTPTDPEIPVEPAPIPDYTPRLVNCTVYDTLYTYTGGTVAVGHRNILPAVNNVSPSHLEKGLQIVRKLDYDEVLDLVLPVTREFDDWTFLFETANDSKYIKAGAIWFKLQYNQLSSGWQLYLPGTAVLEFDAVNENTITIQTSETEIVITGTNTMGELVTIEKTLDAPLPSIGVLRITAYADNPNPRTLQFKLYSSGDMVDYSLPVAGFRAMSISESSKVYSNLKSNAVFGETTKPVVITDALTVNYVEDTLNTYMHRHIGVTYTNASITKLLQINNSTQTTVSCTINDLNDLCLSGALSSLTIHLADENDVESYVTTVYSVTDVDNVTGTYTLTTTVNEAVVDTTTNISVLPFNLLKSIATPDSISIKTDTAINNNVMSVSARSLTRKYRVKYNMVFNKPVVLPVVLFDKTTTQYVPQ